MPTAAAIAEAKERRRQRDAKVPKAQEKAVAAAASRAFDLIADPRWDWFLGEMNGLYERAKSEWLECRERLLPGGNYMEPAAREACTHRYIRADAQIKLLDLLKTAPGELVRMAGGEIPLDKQDAD